jgi:mono/diheme cytochrome c family protein
MRRPLLFALTTLAVMGLLVACGNKEIRDTAAETVVTDPSAAPPPAEEPPAEAPPAEEPPAEEPPAVEGDPVAGEAVFTGNCGACHVLAAAGTAGTIGPDLDDSQPAYDLVIDRVTNGAGAMPPFAGILSDTDIQDVAAYVVQATSGG